MGVKRAYSPKELLKMKHRILPLTGKWKDAFGEPEYNETWFISGPSASGKSSFVMQFAKVLCGIAPVLYVSLEEGFNLSFKRRLEMFKMGEVQGKLRIITTIDDLKERLTKKKSQHFVIIDSFQYTGWDFKTVKSLINAFPRKSFIFISQEDKGKPIGKAAIKLKFASGIKVRTQGYRAYCLGRFIEGSDAYFNIWEERVIEIYNGL